MGSRLWSKFIQHVSVNVGIEEANYLDEPSENTPVYICTWMYLECDIPDPRNNQQMQCLNKTYSQALKMRAAISFHYNELGRGNNSWHQARDGSWIGNPSLSNSVTRYMLRLQRRKVWSLMSLRSRLFSSLSTISSSLVNLN